MTDSLWEIILHFLVEDAKGQYVDIAPLLRTYDIKEVRKTCAELLKSKYIEFQSHYGIQELYNNDLEDKTAIVKVTDPGDAYYRRTFAKKEPPQIHAPTFNNSDGIIYAPGAQINQPNVTKQTGDNANAQSGQIAAPNLDKPTSNSAPKNRIGTWGWLERLSWVITIVAALAALGVLGNIKSCSSPTVKTDSTAKSDSTKAK